MKVKHAKYGIGTVIERINKKYRVKFESGTFLVNCYDCVEI